MLCNHRPRNLSLFWLSNTICSREKVLKAVLAECVPTKRLPGSQCLVDSGPTDGTASGIRRWRETEVIPAQGWAGSAPCRVQSLETELSTIWGLQCVHLICKSLLLTDCFSWRILATINYLNMKKCFKIKPMCLVSLPAYNGWHGYLEKKKFRFKLSFFKISRDFKVVELRVIPHLHLPGVTHCFLIFTGTC